MAVDGWYEAVEDRADCSFELTWFAIADEDTLLRDCFPWLVMLLLVKDMKNPL